MYVDDLQLPSGGFDPLVASDLVVDELRQLEESGHDVRELVREANGLRPDDTASLFEFHDRLRHCPRRPDWPYVEPDDLSAIEASWSASPLSTGGSGLDQEQRLAGAWYGRIAGCMLGKPVEQGDHWTPEHLRSYLQQAHAWPLTGYVPLLDPMPDGFVLRACWPETTLGNITGGARDDDIDYTILGLQLLEQHQHVLSTGDVGRGWLASFPVLQLFTAERATYRNLVNGIAPEESASVRNPYREWIGAQIRADIFGYAFPGQPARAAQFAWRDARLSHVGNGIYGEMWIAALLSQAFVCTTADDVFDQSLAYVPRRSRLREALETTRSLKVAGASWEEAVQEVHRAFGHYRWVHTVNNATLVAIGLLWGEDDYALSVGRTVMGGWDTDSNGATVGSVLGALHGLEAIPERFVEPLRGEVRSAVFGHSTQQIDVLVDRSLKLRAALQR
jgi:ADP-ribosylglycohydrolase